MSGGFETLVSRLIPYGVKFEVQFLTKTRYKRLILFLAFG